MKLKLSVVWTFLVGVTLASFVGVFTVLAMSVVYIPQSIDYGITIPGQAVEKTVMTVLNGSAGAKLNFTVTNITGTATYVLKSPEGTNYEIVPNVYSEISLSGVGNWSLKIIPQQVGQINGLFKFNADNETVFNVTR